MMTDSKRIKAILSVLLVFSLLTSLFLIHGSSYEFYEYYKSQSLITSKDGKYIYKQRENNDEAVFWGSTQKNITVLEIPDEIDGKKVTGVER
ncbi:MAG: hypothetical protein IK063_03280, partial [Clostridia bacterium]|nr:hypothetical protein [Clostridia bacterium]